MSKVEEFYNFSDLSLRWFNKQLSNITAETLNTIYDFYSFCFIYNYNAKYEKALKSTFLHKEFVEFIKNYTLKNIENTLYNTKLKFIKND